MEIKFRAWDKENKVMLDWDYDAQNILEAIPLGVGDEYTDCFEVMQYVGLSDNNGKEIYVGDLVIWMNFGEPIPVTVSEEHGYRFMLGGDIICKSFCSIISIVGNIYENPELLEKNG